jgi:4-hydroxy-tetrahydrodipicolinate reductase
LPVIKEEYMSAITVLVCGASGRMGQEVVKAVSRESDLRLAGAIDREKVGRDIGELCGLGALGVAISDDLAGTLAAAQPRVMVDFTIPAAAMGNIRQALSRGVACVIGTTGLTGDNLEEIAALCAEHNTAALVAPNFAIGAVLMMEFAARAAHFFPKAEIIEMHHDKKLDAPSGTALLTARKMTESPECCLTRGQSGEKPELPRGEVFADRVHIHSVRLPGLVAHQEVIFGGVGQTLTIRHDSLSRESFMPGVILAVRKVLSWKGLIVGLENLL